MAWLAAAVLAFSGSASLWLLAQLIQGMHAAGFDAAVLRTLAPVPAVFVVLLGLQAAAFVWAGRRVAGALKRRSMGPPKRLLLPTALAAASIVFEAFAMPFVAWLALGGTYQTRGNLGALRAAVSIYYGDNARRYPKELGELVPRYLESGIFPAKTLQHGSVSKVTVLTDGDYRAGRFGDTGGWGYVISGSEAGKVIVDCTHRSPKGEPWASL